MSDAEAAAAAEASTRHARQVRRSLSSRERLDQRRQERKARAAERHAKQLEQAESDSPRGGYWMRTAMEHQTVESALKEIFGLDINPLIAVDLDMSSPAVQAQVAARIDELVRRLPTGALNDCWGAGGIPPRLLVQLWGMGGKRDPNRTRSRSFAQGLPEPEPEPEQDALKKLAELLDAEDGELTAKPAAESECKQSFKHLVRKVVSQGRQPVKEETVDQVYGLLQESCAQELLRCVPSRLVLQSAPAPH